MRPRRVFILAIAMTLLLAAMAACGGSIPQATTADTLSSALKAGGLKTTGPEPNGVLDSHVFDVPGVYFTAEGEKVLAYEFASEGDASAAAKPISSDGYGIGSMYVQWGGDPHIYLNGQLLVIYVGNTAKIEETLKTAMGDQIAGAP